MSITPQSLDYIDEAGEAQSIDLEDCARNWGRWRASRSGELRLLPGATEQSAAVWNSRCVGQRDTDAPPWAEFTDERKTRLEFASYEAIYAELLNPLRKVGWHTFDTT